MNDKKRIIKAIRKLEKSSLKLKKAKAERIWIENNPQIHILNYPYYKSKRTAAKIIKLLGFK